MRVVSAGNPAKLIMTGVGLEARQAWPPVKYRSVNVNLINAYDMFDLSISGFDARTDPASTLISNMPFGQRLVPVANVAPTFQYRLLDHIFTGQTMAIETIIAPAPKPLALPSMLILNASVTPNSPNTNQIVGVEFGIDGFRILSLLGAAITYEYSIPYSVVSGSLVRVERFLSWVQVYVNGVRVGAATHPSFMFDGSPGVGTYSSVGSNLSTPIGITTFYGGTSLTRVPKGREMFPLTLIPKSLRVALAKCYIAEAGKYRIAFTNARWVNGTTFSTRRFYTMLNGVQIGEVIDQNGSDYVSIVHNSIPANSIIQVEVFADPDGDPNRLLKPGGYVSYEKIP